MFLTKGLWRLHDMTREIWVRVALYSVLALISAGVSPLIAPFLPEGLDRLMGEAPTLALLTTLTDSMLVVATFSLSVMVAAHQFAASNATPRSHRLLREDGRTQSVLATFIGAFVYALTSRIAISADLYQDRDFPIIYAVTILVTVAVVVNLIRWIQQLTALGSIEKTTERVEEATRACLKELARNPTFGCAPLPGDEAARGTPVKAQAFGYVRHIDVQSLSEATKAGGEIDILVLPGDWIGPGDTVLRTRDMDCDDADLLASIVMGELRSYEQDPIFGLQVMSEIAQRALSPSLNDPQTAIDVIRRQSRLLHLWKASPVEDPLPGLRMRETPGGEAVYVAFDALARDGATMVEVQVALHEALKRLRDHPVPAIRLAAKAVTERALARSDAALDLDGDRERIHAAAG